MAEKHIQSNTGLLQPEKRKHTTMFRAEYIHENHHNTHTLPAIPYALTHADACTC